MPNFFIDLETRSPVPIKNGTHAYAEKAEIMLCAYADEQGDPRVWDVVNATDNFVEELSDTWVEEPCVGVPPMLQAAMADDETLMWAHNGGMFDFVVLARKAPWFTVPMRRWRDTMVQAYSHSLPGALDDLGEILKLNDGDRKLKDEGRKYIRMFCVPQADGTYYDKGSHPTEWAGFIRYAARDITTMRVAHQKMPKWNYRTGLQVDMWHQSLRMNSRGMYVDLELASKAIEAADTAKRRMARRTQELTGGAVQAATQRDAMLGFILAQHGVELPDMRADTLERRMADPELPEAVKELLGIRLRASMNSVSKYATLLRAVNSDGRIRGCSQFRGASRTGRTAHRLFQPGNLPRPAYDHPYIEAGIAAIKAGALDLVVENEMEMCSSAIRGCIIAPPGRKLAVADLSNIEGRVAAWLAGEEWKLQAFRDFDRGEGVDLYIRSYMESFNVQDPKQVTKSMRQIGKICELMFQYGGGVGAWITGATAYGIDLDAMAEAVYHTLPGGIVAGAADFLAWRYEQAPDTDRAKVRFGLSEKVFITCDSLKRLWREAHPKIASYWRELEDTIGDAIDHPGVTFTARKIKVRRDGSWLRLGLPSGRALCYPNIHRTKKGEIAYTGQDTFTRKWGEVKTYGGKVFENATQAVSNDQFEECKPLVEKEGFDIVLDVHDELVTEVDEGRSDSAEALGQLMCSPLGWNEGLPLAAAGEEMTRYRK